MMTEEWKDLALKWKQTALCLLEEASPFLFKTIEAKKALEKLMSDIELIEKDVEQRTTKDVKILASELYDYGRCEGCQAIARLVQHHWWESWEDRISIDYYTKRLCSTCNGFLNRDKLEALNITCPPVPNGQKPNNILPSWLIQQIAIQLVKEDEFSQRSISKWKATQIEYSWGWNTQQRENTLAKLLGLLPKDNLPDLVKLGIQQWKLVGKL